MLSLSKHEPVRGKATGPLEQPLGLAPAVDMDFMRGGIPGQAGHGHDLAADDDEEFGAGGEADLADRHDMDFRRDLEVGVGREAVLSFGDADRKTAVSGLLVDVEMIEDPHVRGGGPGA